MNDAPADPSFTAQKSPLRFYVVALFALLQFCAAWHLQFFTSIPDIISQCYAAADIDSDDINLSVSIGCLFSILFSPLLPFLDRFSNNIRSLLILSAFLQLLQVAIRILPHLISSLTEYARVFMFLTAILANLGSGFASALPSRVSSYWFPPEERVIATSVASQAMAIGTAVSFLAIGLIVQTTDDAKVFLLVMLGIQFVLFLLVLFTLPARPKHYPSYSEYLRDQQLEAEAEQIFASLPESERRQNEKKPLLEGDSPEDKTKPRESAMTRLPLRVRIRISLQPVKEMFSLFKQRTMLLLWLVAILQYGPVQSFAINLPTLYQGLGDTSDLSSYITFAHLLLNTIGAVFFSTISQKHPRNEKKIIIVILFVSLAFSAFFIACFGLGSSTGSITKGEGSEQTSIKTYDAPIDMPKWLLSVLVCIDGFFTGALIPVFFELGAEMCYPVSPGISGAFTGTGTGIGMVVITFVYSAVGPGYYNVVTTATLFVASIVVFFFQIKYVRSDLEAAARNGNINVSEEDNKTNSTVQPPYQTTV